VAIYLANALVPVEGVHYIYRLGRLDSPLAAQVVRALAARADGSAIGHPSTARLLGVEPSRAELQPEAGDVLVVVRLARRNPTSGGDVDVTPADLEALLQLVLGPAPSLDSAVDAILLGSSEHPENGY
jgi:hypothetical protein